MKVGVSPGVIRILNSYLKRNVRILRVFCGVKKPNIETTFRLDEVDTFLFWIILIIIDTPHGIFNSFNAKGDVRRSRIALVLYMKIMLTRFAQHPFNSK